MPVGCSRTLEDTWVVAREQLTTYRACSYEKLFRGKKGQKRQKKKSTVDRNPELIFTQFQSFRQMRDLVHPSKKVINHPHSSRPRQPQPDCQHNTWKIQLNSRA